MLLTIVFLVPATVLAYFLWRVLTETTRSHSPICVPALFALAGALHGQQMISAKAGLLNFGAREKLTGFARQNLPTDLASSRELMQGSDFRFRSCCPRANRNGYAHLDEDNSFAARQKSGADDIAVSTPYAAHTPKTARNAVLRVGNSIRVQMGNFWRAPRLHRAPALFVRKPGLGAGI